MQFVESQSRRRARAACAMYGCVRLGAPTPSYCARRRLRRLLTATLVALVCALHSAGAVADARSDYLIRLLQGADQFRVRAQAAISLGAISGASDVVRALSGALSDKHPAVRAAAANSLGRLGDPSAIAALRVLQDDREPPVRVAAKAAITRLEAAARNRGTEVEPAKPTGPPRFYVAMGKPASKVPSLAAAELDAVADALRDGLRALDGVVMAPPGEAPADARAVLDRKRLKGFYIESSVTSVEPKSGGTRVAVSIIVATYPGRDMRAIMSGAATAIGGNDAKQQAFAGAIRSALRKLPQAMERD